ncbi:MAG TPA: TRC40/GET3/ArsA family transport-energizing ATPase [Candidatus Acidoferrales bacterium]|nr:TRC40/GET3/ArsA family transport-energizing ATPase [Candidatus Acidoferrales bacterium]
MRIILYSGKGGVGKTSIAAATGLELARLGYKTLVMSVDPAHSLSDSFDLDKGLMDHESEQARKIRPNLWMQEVDVQEEIVRYWDEVYSYVTMLLRASGLEEVVAEELAIFPGMEEVCSLLYVNQYVREKSFDVILLDCAPTGESLRFISIPTALDWYMNRIFKVERRVVKVVRPMISAVTPLPLPDDSYFQNIEALHSKLQGIDRVLADPKITTVRLVTNPEKVVLKETQRAFTYFCLYGMTLDAVIVNRILPRQVEDEFFAHWKDTQERYVAAMDQFFSPVPIWKLPLFQDEVVGVPSLERLGRELYCGKDPAQIYFDESPYRFKKVDGSYQLQIRLPFVERREVELYKKSDELIIRIGNFKRHVSLPQAMTNASPRSARIQGDRLIISFGGKNARQPLAKG